MKNSHEEKRREAFLFAFTFSLFGYAFTSEGDCNLCGPTVSTHIFQTPFDRLLLLSDPHSQPVSHIFLSSENRQPLHVSECGVHIVQSVCAPCPPSQCIFILPSLKDRRSRFTLSFASSLSPGKIGKQTNKISESWNWNVRQLCSCSVQSVDH